MSQTGRRVDERRRHAELLSQHIADGADAECLRRIVARVKNDDSQFTCLRRPCDEDLRPRRACRGPLAAASRNVAERPRRRRNRSPMRASRGQRSEQRGDELSAPYCSANERAFSAEHSRGDV